MNVRDNWTPVFSNIYTLQYLTGVAPKDSFGAAQPYAEVSVMLERSCKLPLIDFVAPDSKAIAATQGSLTEINHLKRRINSRMVIQRIFLLFLRSHITPKFACRASAPAEMAKHFFTTHRPRH